MEYVYLVYAVAKHEGNVLLGSSFNQSEAVAFARGVKMPACDFEPEVQKVEIGREYKPSEFPEKVEIWA